MSRVARNKIIDTYRKKKTERLEDIRYAGKSNEEENYFLNDLIESNLITPDDQFDNSLLMIAI